MKLPAPSHSQRMGKLAEIDYGSFGSSPWCIKCLDDKEQYIICEILFDEIVSSANGASPCWSQILPSNKLTWGLSLPCCDWWRWESSTVVIHPISVLCGSQDENGIIPNELSMVSPPSPPMGHTFRADYHLNLFCPAPHALLTPYSLLLFPLFILWICFWANFVSRQDQGTLKDKSAQCSSFS